MKHDVSDCRCEKTNNLYLEVCCPNAYNHYPWEGYKDVGTGAHDATNPWCINGRWRAAYRGVGRTNTIIAKIDSINMSADAKASIKGEAYFLRAVYYFNLVDFYGGVPLVTDSPAL